MNIKLFLPALFLLIVAAACAGGASATDLPASAQPDDGQADRIAPGRTIATSAPATVSRPVLSVPTATSISAVSPSVTRPSPVPVATSVLRSPVPSPVIVPTQATGRDATAIPSPVRRDPNLTPTPLWGPAPKSTAVPTSVPTAIPTLFVPPTVSGSPEDLFDQTLNYQYLVPTGWSIHRTESSLVLTDRTGKITVTVTEVPVERWRYQAVITLGTSTSPDRPSQWSTWTPISTSLIKSGAAYEFQYIGVKSGASYRQFVHWYIWGDVRVQVSADVPEFDWASNAAIRTTFQSILTTFTPHDGTHLLTNQDVLDLMFERLDDRPSGIFVRNEALRARVEMSCRDIYNDLLNPPDYLGNGLWQMTATTALHGTEAWWVFEPNGSIMNLNSNISRC